MMAVTRRRSSGRWDKAAHRHEGGSAKPHKPGRCRAFPDHTSALRLITAVAESGFLHPFHHFPPEFASAAKPPAPVHVTCIESPHENQGFTGDPRGISCFVFPIRGILNIPGADTLPLSDCIRHSRARSLPLPGPILPALYSLRRRLRGADFSYELNAARLHFSSALDGRRAATILQYVPRAPIRWSASGAPFYETNAATHL